VSGENNVKKFSADLIVPEFDIENYYGGTVRNKNWKLKQETLRHHVVSWSLFTP